MHQSDLFYCDKGLGICINYLCKCRNCTKEISDEWCKGSCMIYVYGSKCRFRVVSPNRMDIEKKLEYEFEIRNR